TITRSSHQPPMALRDRSAVLLDGDHLRARAVTGLEGFGLSLSDLKLPRTL
ncbi:MAG: hypothetical protein RLZZ481_2412, partial [Pseudomonadota bacterium]